MAERARALCVLRADTFADSARAMVVARTEKGKPRESGGRKVIGLTGQMAPRRQDCQLSKLHLVCGQKRVQPASLLTPAAWRGVHVHEELNLEHENFLCRTADRCANSSGDGGAGCRRHCHCGLANCTADTDSSARSF